MTRRRRDASEIELDSNSTNMQPLRRTMRIDNLPELDSLSIQPGLAPEHTIDTTTTIDTMDTTTMDTVYLEEDDIHYEDSIIDSNSIKNGTESETESGTDAGCSDVEWVKYNCYKCTSSFTLDEYNKSDLDDLVSVKMLNSKGKFTKGLCFKLSEFLGYLQSDIGRMPANVMAIYTSPLRPKTSNDYTTGITSVPTGRFVVRLPENGVYISLGSAKRLFDEYSKKKSGTVWYALPLYGGKRKRIGNLFGVYGSSTNHGQAPGYTIYKLLSKKELVSGHKVSVERQDFPIELFMENDMQSLFDILKIPNTPQQFSDSIIKSVIKTAAPLNNMCDPQNHQKIMDRLRREISLSKSPTNSISKIIELYKYLSNCLQETSFDEIPLSKEYFSDAIYQLRNMLEYINAMNGSDDDKKTAYELWMAFYKMDGSKILKALKRKLKTAMPFSA